MLIRPLAALILGCAAYTASGQPSTQSEEPGKPSVASPQPPPQFIVGVGTHLGKRQAGQTARQVLLRARDAHVLSIRDEFYWQDVERVKGRLKIPDHAEEIVRECEQAGIRPLIVLGYGNRFYDDAGYPLSSEAREAFVRYAEFVVRHFKGRVSHYEIWNEWDMGLGLPLQADGKRPRGDAAEYVKLTAAVYPRLKAIDPGITVLAGGQAMYSLHSRSPGEIPDSGDSWGRQKGWFDDVLSQGLIRHCDGLSLHPYVKAIEDPEHWIGWLQRLQERYARQFNENRPVPFYVTEIGWFTHSGARVDWTAQADYIARLFLLARTLPEMKGLWYFHLQGHEFGLGDAAGGSPRSAFWSLADVAELVATGDFLGRLETANPDIWILRFRMPDGTERWAAWSRGKLGFSDRRYNSFVTGTWSLKLKNEGDASRPLIIRMAGAGAFTQPWGQRVARAGRVDPSVCEITLGPRPQIIAGDFSKVRVIGLAPNHDPVRPPAVPSPGLEDAEGKTQGVPDA